MKILVATTNKGKLAEFDAMLDLDVDWAGLDDIGDFDEVVEDGANFAANACKKALGYARVSGLMTIADDSGLVIDALDGAPGIHSARFSGEKEPGEKRGLIDHRNCAKVLKLMEGVPAERRTARFVCRLAVAMDGEIVAEAEGVFEGMIGQSEQGENGFGYDPIFFIPEHGCTAAQLSAAEKNAVSHRGRAIEQLKPMIVELLADMG